MKSYKTMSNVDLANLSQSQGFKVKGNNKGDNTGWSIVGGGDFNCDGEKDFAVSAPHFNAGLDPNSGAGIIYLIPGQKGRNISEILLNNTLPNDAIKIAGAINYGEAGFSLNLDLDINNDQCNELVIGAPFADSGYTYIIKGSKNLPSEINLSNLNDLGITIIGDEKYYGGALGYTIAAIGDFDNNGYQDLLLGAPWASRCSVIYFDKSMPNTINLGKISADEILVITDKKSTNFCRSASSAGDFNNNKNLGLLIGDSSKNSNAGAVYVLNGTGKKMTGTIDINDLNSTQLITFNGAPGSYLGEAVSYGGDVNGDGPGDILMSTGVTNQVHLVFGGQQLSNSFTFGQNTYNGTTYYGNPGSKFGASIKGNLNLTGDSLNDFCIGAPYENNYKGSVYCFNGDKNLPRSIDAYNLDKKYGFRIDGPSSGSSIGGRVGGGDIDGDELDDILISDSNEESAFVVYSNPSIAPTPSLMPTSSPTSSAYEPTCFPTQNPTPIPTPISPDNSTSHKNGNSDWLPYVWGGLGTAVVATVVAVGSCKVYNWYYPNRRLSTDLIDGIGKLIPLDYMADNAVRNFHVALGGSESSSSCSDQSSLVDSCWPVQV